MNANKITVPPSVATAIAHYVTLADTKSEAFTDILSMGFEGGRSEIILRHFDGNHDELMEALICGYEVEGSQENMIREYYDGLLEYAPNEYTQGTVAGVLDTLNILGIKVAGVND
jgi:hypothetical protein